MSTEFPEIKTEIKVENKADDSKATIYLSGVIRKSFPWENPEDCISAEVVKKLLKQLNGKDVEIRLNSPGGDVFESVEICNELKAYEGDVNTVVTALAGSGASVIATASKVSMYANAMQMIHNSSTGVWGNAKYLRKMAGDLEKIDKGAVKESYMKKFVGTEEELKQLLDEETWLTAKECLALGLCDEIIDEEAKEEPPKNNIKETLLNKYGKNIQAKAGGNTPSLFSAFQKQSGGDQ